MPRKRLFPLETIEVDRERLTNPVLWDRLAAFDFEKRFGASDDHACEPEFTFAGKLSAAEGWQKDYTQVAIEEYRRFLYLTQIGNAQATPSAVIDRVWHMHQTYTHEYWEYLCDGVFGRPLHHEPCLNAASMPRYREQYAKTMQLYVSEFGDLPLRNVWQTEADAEKYKKLAKLRSFFWILWATAGIAVFAAAALSVLTAILVTAAVVVAVLIARGKLADAMSEIGPGYLPKSTEHPAKTSSVSGGSGGCGGCGG